MRPCPGRLIRCPTCRGRAGRSGRPPCCWPSEHSSGLCASAHMLGCTGPSSGKHHGRCMTKLAVFISLTAVMIGCRDAHPPTPDVPPPPAAIVPGPPPLPVLPPEERATRVLPLDSRTCGAKDAAYIDHTIAEVLARCVATGTATQVVLTVLSRATARDDYLHAIAQRFCGDVIDATGPEGWSVRVKRYREDREVAAEVTWDAPASARAGQPTARRITASRSRFGASGRRGWATTWCSRAVGLLACPPTTAPIRTGELANA
jgi:hypothetical protein